MKPSLSFTRLLGITVPIVCAPMGGVAGGRLARAISTEGALGMIGMGSAGSRASLERELRELESFSAPFGIGLVDWVMKKEPELLPTALGARPAALAVSFADWNVAPSRDWVTRANEQGTVTITQVASLREAEQAAARGVQVIVARGKEGGGHGDPAHRLSEILPDIVQALDVPVLAAGAIGTSTDVSRALGTGAAGVWVGTAFSACHEAQTSVSERAALFRTSGSGTAVTRVLDTALGYPWPRRFPERVISTPFVERWNGREEELASDAVALAEFRAASAREDYSIVPIDAGLGVESLTESRSAHDVIKTLLGITPSVQDRE